MSFRTLPDFLRRGAACALLGGLIFASRHPMAAFGAQAPEASPPAAPAPKAAEAEAATPPPTLAVADLVPAETALKERKAKLPDKLAELGNLNPFQEKVEDLRQRLEAMGSRLESLRSSGSYGFDQVAEVRAAARVVIEGLQQILDEAAKRLAAISAAKKEWGEQKARWKASREALDKDAGIKAVEPTFRAAVATIDEALKLLSGAETPLVEFQRKVVEVQSRAQSLASDADALLQQMKGDIFRKSRPSLVSPRFYGQFDASLARDLRASFRSLSLPAAGFFAAKGWIVLFQVLASLAVAVAIRRHARGGARVSERWRFLMRRPFSTGFFVGGTVPLFLYGPMPSLWWLLMVAVIAVAAARLAAGLIDLPWRRRLLYLLTGVLLCEQFLGIIGFPTPLFRLFVVAVGAAGCALCLWRARENRRRGASPVYVGALRLGAAVLLAVFVAEVGGYSGLAIHLLEASFKTTFLLIFARMLALLVRGGLEFLVEHPLARRSPILRNHGQVILARSGIVVDVVVAFLALAAVLQIWRFYDTLSHAMESILEFGFPVDGRRITVGLVATGLVVLYGALLISWLVQRTLDEEVYPRRGVEQGVRISVNRLIQYAFVLVGFLTALSVLGIGLEKFAILAGAFGIGIGFGLQNIVNNFVSGLILLFERPIKVGDVVTIDGEWATVKKLGLRATVVQTFGRSDVIVPNSDLISNKVTNWTLTDRLVRVVVQVGIAYGSDVPLAMSVLEQVAVDNSTVRAEPKPQVLFMGFGDSSLDFELRCWLDVEQMISAKSELHQEIDRRFRDAGIEISFPQRDLHLRTVDDRAGRSLSGLGPAAPREAKEKTGEGGLE